MYFYIKIKIKEFKLTTKSGIKSVTNKGNKIIENFK